MTGRRGGAPSGESTAVEQPRCACAARRPADRLLWVAARPAACPSRSSMSRAPCGGASSTSPDARGVGDRATARPDPGQPNTRATGKGDHGKHHVSASSANDLSRSLRVPLTGSPRGPALLGPVTATPPRHQPPTTGATGSPRPPRPGPRTPSVLGTGRRGGSHPGTPTPDPVGGDPSVPRAQDVSGAPLKLLFAGQAPVGSTLVSATDVVQVPGAGGSGQGRPGPCGVRRLASTRGLGNRTSLRSARVAPAVACARSLDHAVNSGAPVAVWKE